MAGLKNMYLFDNSSKGLSHPSWQALKNGTGKENEICRAM